MKIVHVVDTASRIAGGMVESVMGLASAPTPQMPCRWTRSGLAASSAAVIERARILSTDPAAGPSVSGTGAQVARSGGATRNWASPN